jgi:NAD(P)-dependent dehydrogenase (short-subunit alcohol dehydrogenase family)
MEISMKLFKDKAVIVTGGASGIGRSLCDQLARHGAYVVMADINFEQVEKAAESLLEKGLKVKAVHLDVTDELAFKKTIEDTAAEYGQLDYLFNNAGIAVLGEVHNLTMDHWRKVFDVNLNGVLHGTFHAYQLMVKQGSGHIVNLSSVEGVLPFPTTVSYVGTKHAVFGLSESLWVEAADMGVDITIICPGYIRTPMLDSSEAVNTTMDTWKKSILVVLFEKLSAITPNTCAKLILKGVAKKKIIVFTPKIGRLFWWNYRIWPTMYMRMLRFFHRMDRKRVKKLHNS